MKILIRGGSIAAGLGVARSYADILRETYKPRGIEVVNRSRAGETSFDGMDFFERDIEPYRPEILLLHFGVDDAFSSVFRSEFRENLVHIVRLARERFDPLVFLLTSHAFDDPGDRDAVGIYYRGIREVAADLYCEMIPIHIYWAGWLLARGLPSSDFLQLDRRYPNERGHEIYAEAVTRSLDKVLALMADL